MPILLNVCCNSFALSRSQTSTKLARPPFPKGWGWEGSTGAPRSHHAPRCHANRRLSLHAASQSETRTVPNTAIPRTINHCVVATTLPPTINQPPTEIRRERLTYGGRPTPAKTFKIQQGTAAMTVGRILPQNARAKRKNT